MKSPKVFSPSEKKQNSLNLKTLIMPTLFCLVCGLLLILLRSWALKISAWIIAALLIFWGGKNIYEYLRADVMTRITESRLAIGLGYLVSGILLAFSPDFLKDFLPFIWGLSMLFGAFLKIEYAFDERTVKVEKWWIMLIFAAVSMILGILSLLRPSFFGDNMELIVGIFMILEAVLDVVVFCLLNKGMKEQMPKITYTIPNPQADSPAALEAPAAQGADPVPAQPAPETPAAPAAPAPAPAPAPAQPEPPAVPTMDAPAADPASAPSAPPVLGKE